MAALRSGQVSNATHDLSSERDPEMELAEECLAGNELGAGADASTPQSILPIQLESLLPEPASASDFTFSAGASTPCMYPSLPRSAPPCSPPLIESFDITPPPPPLQDLSACDQWQQWPSHMPWADTDCSSWMTYPQELCFDADVAEWQAIEECMPAVLPVAATPPLPGLRSSPPEVTEEGSAFWKLPSASASEGTRVFLTTQRGMLNAYEVLDSRWDPCPSGPRMSSCPAELRYGVDAEACSDVNASDAQSAPPQLPPNALSSSSASPAKLCQGDVDAKPALEAASPARGGARQAKARTGQPVRMVWRKKSLDGSDVGEALSPSRQSCEEHGLRSPTSRGGRPRVGRSGPRGCADDGVDAFGLWLQKRCEG